jgi:hypothetical protein
MVDGDGDVGRRRRGRWPSGMAGMLGLVLAVECWLAAHPRRVMQAGLWDCWTSVRAAGSLTPGRDVLCLGDSLMKLSVVPGLAVEGPGRSGYNLGVSGSQPPTGYALLRRAFEAGARPSVVLLSYSVRALQGESEASIDHWSLFLGHRECLELAWEARDPALFAALMVRRILPSVRGRNVLRGDIRDALAGRDDSGYGILPRFERNWRLNQGAQVMPSNRALATFPLDADANASTWLGRRGLNPASLAYLDRLIDLAGSHGARVYWLQTPVLPAVQASGERQGFDADQTRRLAGLLARHPGLAVIDGRRAGYGPTLFMDPVHLGREGARALSVGLTGLLGPATGPPRRWIDLPPYRSTGDDIKLDQVEWPGPVATGTEAAVRRR